MTVAFFFLNSFNPANIYLLKVNNKNTRKKCEICSDLTIKTSDDVIDVILVLLLTMDMFDMFSNISIVDFEQVHVGVYVTNVFWRFLSLTLNIFNIFF